MTVHMFSCYIGRGKMSVSDLESRIDDWVASNGAWADDPVEHTLSEHNTAPDGSGETYYMITVRFLQDQTKDNLLQKFTDRLKGKVDWYRVGYHNCTHDETNATPCSWDDAVEWTAKGVTIPAGVPTIDVEVS